MDATASGHAGATAPDEWSARVSGLVAALMAEWRLTATGPAAERGPARVQPVVTDDGIEATLEVAPQDPDRAGSVVALQTWGGKGAARLLTADPRRGAVLLERLGDAALTVLPPLDGCTVVTGLYPELHVPATAALPQLAPFVAARLDGVAGLGRDVPLPGRFARQALVAGRSLLADMPRTVVHGDLTYHTVVAGGRRPWLAVAPYGFAGDPCYEPAPLLWHRWGDYGSDLTAGILDRFWAIVDGTGWDERRVRDWVVVRSVAEVAATVARAGRRPLSARDLALVTRMIVTCKAMQGV